MYGFLRGLLSTLREAQAQERPWVYLDRGYLRATYGNDYSGYFRVTRDAWQHDGSGEYDNGRWRALGLEIKPWQKDGTHVLVCPPGDIFSESVGGFKASLWLKSVLAKLSRSTKRPVIVRMKSEARRRPLGEDLRGAHALVTYMSNTAVEALIEGVPIFCSEQSAAFSMGKFEITEIESPAYPEGREFWAAALAGNQWTLDELRAGAANHLFQERIQMPHGLLRLSELEPTFLHIEDERTYRMTDKIEEADGISMRCPKCYWQKGRQTRGVHSVICWKPNVPQSFFPVPGRWSLVGGGYEDLSLQANSSSVFLTAPGGCGAHFHVTKGNVTNCEGTAWL